MRTQEPCGSEPSRILWPCRPSPITRTSSRSSTGEERPASRRRASRTPRAGYSGGAVPQDVITCGPRSVLNRTACGRGCPLLRRAGGVLHQRAVGCGARGRSAVAPDQERLAPAARRRCRLGPGRVVEVPRGPRPRWRAPDHARVHGRRLPLLPRAPSDGGAELRGHLAASAGRVAPHQEWRPPARGPDSLLAPRNLVEVRARPRVVCQADGTSSGVRVPVLLGVGAWPLNARWRRSTPRLPPSGTRPRTASSRRAS